MKEEAVCVGVDVAKSTLDVASSDSRETRQFANNDEGISQAVRYISGVKPSRIILELPVVWKCLWPRLSRAQACRWSS